MFNYKRQTDQQIKNARKVIAAATVLMVVLCLATLYNSILVGLLSILLTITVLQAVVPLDIHLAQILETRACRDEILSSLRDARIDRRYARIATVNKLYDFKELGQMLPRRKSR